jgi:hypothetical protein
MLGFNHALAGSIVAVLTPASLVPVIALVLHFVLDTFPHFGNSNRVYPYTRPFKQLLAADALLCIAGVIFAISLFPHLWLIILVGAFFGVLPDFLWIWREKGPSWFQRFLQFANWIQWGERPYGWLFDVFYGLMMVIILYVLAT